MSTVRRRVAWYAVLAVVLIGSVGAMVAQQQGEPADPIKKQDTAALAIAVALARDVRDGLKNPTSFDLVHSVVQADGSVCMTYRATNSFNAVVLAEAVRPRRGKQYWLSDQDAEEFKRQWAIACKTAAADQARMVKRLM